MKNLIGHSENMRNVGRMKTSNSTEPSLTQNPACLSTQTLNIPNWNKYEDIWNEKLKMLNAQALKKKIKSRNVYSNLERTKNKKYIDEKLERL